MDDVIIVGGSFAGLSAALLLGRTRRKVTVIDSGSPRNRFAAHAHNLLGFDNVPPAEILSTARRQIEAYPTVRFVSGRVEEVAGTRDDFRLFTSAGDLAARRLVLSYGVTDEMPALPGFAECWGKSVLHCPYCHGYEVAGRPWGLLYASPLSLHAPTLYADWTPKVILFLDGHELPDAERHKLVARGVEIVEPKVVAIDHHRGHMGAVRLEGGRVVPLEALFAHPRNHPSADLHRQLGLTMYETPFGEAVQVDDKQMTSAAGVYAAGDLTTAMYSLFSAVRDGAYAGVQAQQSLIMG